MKQSPTLPRTWPNAPVGARHQMTASGEDSFWAWRSMAADFADVALDAANPAEGFQVEIDGRSLGDGMIVQLALSGQVIRRSPFTIARGRLDHYVIQLCRRGSYEGQVGVQSVQVRPGDTSILDMADTLHVRTEDLETLNLVLPRAILAPLVLDPEGLHGIVLAAGSPQGELVSQHLQSLCAQAGQISEAEAPALLNAAAMLIAACTSVAVAGRTPHPASPTPSIMRILHAIERELADPDLSAELLMRRFGLSRAALYRLFVPYGGVVKHIRSQRLKRCFAEITSPGGARKRIAAIAEDWGFASEAVFSRSFREAFGMSPREARRAAMAARSTPSRQVGKTAPRC